VIPIDLFGRAVVITGASRGIGRAMALAFAHAGARLALNYRENDDAARALLKEIESGGGEVILCKGSITEQAVVDELMSRCVQAFHTIDVLVNNAGITRDAYVPFMKEADWDAVLDVNLKSTFTCCKAALRKMIAQRRGAIVNVSSVGAVVGREGQTNYAAAKAGLLGFTKALAREVGRSNVRVNAIVAGLIDTDMTRALPRKIIGPVLSQAALQRMGTPEEVANLAVFLASDLASYITGSFVHVDGGL
jgi:3-oxoacyl-[acyl-carrier protein] reductase